VVQALAWCPWQPHLIATGGGTRDGLIRIYSARTGAEVSNASTNSQISSLHWSHHTTELVTTHGFAWVPRTTFSAPRKASILVHGVDTNNYKLTAVSKTLDPYHGRISDSCMNPDYTRLMTAGGDQTVKVWRIFGEPKNKRKRESVMLGQLNVR
jgi:cell division cycle protein 20 (cofactor of APC complex)